MLPANLCIFKCLFCASPWSSNRNFVVGIFVMLQLDVCNYETDNIDWSCINNKWTDWKWLASMATFANSWRLLSLPLDMWRIAYWTRSRGTRCYRHCPDLPQCFSYVARWCRSSLSVSCDLYESTINDMIGKLLLDIIEDVRLGMERPSPCWQKRKFRESQPFGNNATEIKLRATFTIFNTSPKLGCA